MITSAGAGEAPGPSRGRWSILAGLAWMSAGTGFVAASLAPVVPALMRDLALSPTTTGVALGAWQAALGLSSVAVGALISRWGAARVVAVGAALTALSSLSRAAAVDGLTLVLAVALGGVAWSMVISGAASLLTTAFEGRARRLGAGITFGGLSAGFALMLAVGPHLAGLPGGWRTALAAGAVPMLAGLPAWLLLSRELRARPPAAARIRQVLGQSLDLLRRPSILSVLAATLAGISAGHALASWLPTVLGRQGLSASLAGLVAAGYMAIGILSSISVTVVARPHHRRWWITGGLAAVAASLLLLAVGSAPLVAAGIVAAGVAIGFLPSLLVLAMLESPPARSLGGAAGGLYYSMSGFAGLTGPVVIGVFADWTGGFTAGLVAMAALVAAGAAVAAGALPMPPSAAASASEAA